MNTVRSALGSGVPLFTPHAIPVHSMAAARPLALRSLGPVESGSSAPIGLKAPGKVAGTRTCASCWFCGGSSAHGASSESPQFLVSAPVRNRLAVMAQRMPHGGRRVSSRFKKTAKEAIRDGPETPWLPLAAPRSKLMHAGRVPRCAPWTPPPLNEASSVRARRRALSYVWRRLRMNVGTDWRADHSDIQCTQQRRRSPCSTDAVCMHNGA